MTAVNFARMLPAMLLLGSTFAAGQDAPAETAPRPQIIIKLPDGVRSELVWIRYSIWGQGGGRGDFVKAVPNAHEYTIVATYGGEPALAANVIVYAPGCQFKTYMFDRPDVVSKDFVCDALPTKTIRGFLPPKEIPRPWVAAEKTVDVVADFTADWTCGYLMTQKHAGKTIVAGSCLGHSVPLGHVGEIDLTSDGHFYVAVPDFTSDPLFADYADRPDLFGVIYLVLREKVIDRTMAVIQPKDNAPPMRGLAIRPEYPDPVVFAKIP